MSEFPHSENADDATVAGGATDDAAFDPPQSIAPVLQLSTRGFFIALALVCLIPLGILSTYAALFGKATEHSLPVRVHIDRRPASTQDGPMSAQDGPSPGLEDVIVIENEADFAISNLAIDLNGRYFLYHDKPLAVGETLVLPQTVFTNRTSQRWVPGHHRVKTITIMGKLPSGARGVTVVNY